MDLVINEKRLWMKEMRPLNLEHLRSLYGKFQSDASGSSDSLVQVIPLMPSIACKNAPNEHAYVHWLANLHNNRSGVVKPSKARIIRETTAVQAGLSWPIHTQGQAWMGLRMASCTLCFLCLVQPSRTGTFVYYSRSMEYWSPWGKSSITLGCTSHCLFPVLILDSLK